MTALREWDGYTEEELFETSKEMMSTQAPPPSLSFETWCTRLRKAPRKAPAEVRTGTSSTTVSQKFVPEEVGYWSDFPNAVAAWKDEMLATGLAEVFPHLAKEETVTYTTGSVPRQVITCEPSTVTSLQVDYFGMVNDFNLSFFPLLNPNLPPVVRESTEVFTHYRVANMSIFGKPDIIITDGTDSFKKVGFGEIKTPWVLRLDSIQELFQSLPIENFGRDFLAEHDSHQPLAIREGKLNMGKAITQLYHDLLSDGLTLGFLATTERIIYCFIPPNNRRRIELFMNPVYREERTWNIRTPEARRFTAQVGLATLAWLGKRIYFTPQPHPLELKVFEYWRPPRQVPEERRDPTYQPPGFYIHHRQPSYLSGNPSIHHGQRRDMLLPMTEFPQYCTALCLKALKNDSFHPDCPNAENHKRCKFTIESVINDVLECIRYAQVKVVGGGNSAKCAAVRSGCYGHGLIVKLYDENTEQYLYQQELDVYDHLVDIQGIYTPVVVASATVQMGSFSRMIFMSYGGIPLQRCTANDDLIDELIKAAVAMHAHGVVLDDSSPNNLLVHNNKVSVIDFESALIVNPPSPAAVEKYKIEMESIAENVRVSGNLKALLP